MSFYYSATVGHDAFTDHIGVGVLLKTFQSASFKDLDAWQRQMFSNAMNSLQQMWPHSIQLPEIALTSMFLLSAFGLTKRLVHIALLAAVPDCLEHRSRIKGIWIAD
jgi:hypothetical protein